MSSITDMQPGDFVKVGSEYKEIKSIWGVNGKKLAKPSEGFFGVIATDGKSYTGWKINRYYKRDELPAEARS